MSFFITLLLTFVVIFSAFILFIKIAPPVYRLEKSNVIALLVLVVEEKATDSDWDVFLGVSIRHDDQLEAIRVHCCDISEREYLGQSGRLLTRKGVSEVKVLLSKLIEMDE